LLGGVSRDAHRPVLPASVTTRAPPARRREPAPARAEVREIGEAQRAEIVATYDYTDRAGRLLYQVVRYHPKTFRQRRPHPARAGAWVWHLSACADQKGGAPCDCGLPAQPLTLYRIPEVIAGLEAGDTVYVVATQPAAR
jgi:hypothetical protein